MHYAALADNLEVVRVLLDSGADVNAPRTAGVTPLYIATQQGRATPREATGPLSTTCAEVVPQRRVHADATIEYVDGFVCAVGSGGANCKVGSGRPSIALPDEFVFLPLRVIIRTDTGEPSESANGPNNESGTTSSISELNSAQRT